MIIEFSLIIASAILLVAAEPMHNTTLTLKNEIVLLVGSVWVLLQSTSGESVNMPDPPLVGGAGSATVVVDGAPSAAVSTNAKRLTITSKAGR